MRNGQSTVIETVFTSANGEHLLSSETHLAKIAMSTSCCAYGEMDPNVWNTEPVAAPLSYAERSVSQIWALSPAVPDFEGPCQSKARVLSAFCWKP